MKSAVLNYAAIMEIDRKDRAKRNRRASRQVWRQNFAARHGYKFWNRVFNLFAL